MDLSIGKELAALPRMTVKELRQRYAAVFGGETNANNQAWLVKGIAWRMQALSETNLSDRARRRLRSIGLPGRPSRDWGTIGRPGDR